MKRIAALLFFALACLAIAYSLQLRIYTSSGPGAGLFPLIIGAALAALSLVWFFQQVRLPASPSSANAATPTRSARTGLQLAALIGFGLLLRPFGYIAAAAFLAVATALIAGERNWMWMAVVAAVTSVGVSLLFNALGTTI